MALCRIMNVSSMDTNTMMLRLSMRLLHIRAPTQPRNVKLFDTKAPRKSSMLPPIPNTDLIASSLHKDKGIPFNIVRDVINIPKFTRQQQDDCHQAWLDYSLVLDINILYDEVIKYDKASKFWINSLKVVMQTPELLPKFLTVLQDGSLADILGIPTKSYTEKLISLLIYHRRFKEADILIKRLLQDKEDIDWKLLHRVCILVEGREPRKLLSNAYRSTPKKNTAYISIMSSLRSLNMSTVTLSQWSNRILALEGICDIQSDSLNIDLKSKLDTFNLKGFESCLYTLFTSEKPKNWLSPKTALLIARYITSFPERKQEPIFLEILQQFKDQSFGHQFWGHLYKQSKLSVKVLELYSETPQNLQSQHLFASSKAQYFVERNQQHQFWKFIDSITGDDQTLLAVAPEMLIMKVRKSDNLHESFSLVKSILESCQEWERDKVIQSFILEVTDAILTRKLFHHVKMLDRFEAYLKDSCMWSRKSENMFLYSDLKVLRLQNAKQRLDLMFEEDKSVITASTLDTLVSVFFKHTKLLKKRGIIKPSETGEPLEYAILRLIFKCHSHCPIGGFKPITWGRILNYIVNKFPLEETKPFMIQIAHIISQERHHGSNIVHLNKGNLSHPIRIAFSDQLIRKIIHRGFVDHQHEDPWIGFRMVLELEKNGVFVLETTVKGQLIKLLKISHNLPGVKTRIRSYKGVDLSRESVSDVEATIGILNEMWSRNR